MRKPILGITMGDPYSVGSEVTAKVFSNPTLFDICQPLVVGNPQVMAQSVQQLGLGQSLTIHTIDQVSQARFQPGVIDVLAVEPVPLRDDELGKITVNGGESAFRYVEKVIQLALAGEVDGTVTNALSKEAIHMAGHNFSGHTEIYAHYTNTPKYAMLLAHENMRVLHVSTHVSLREACDRVTQARVLEVIEMANQACKALGIATPRVAVAGLNPHSGEDGLFGWEEQREIIPAIQAAQAKGIQVAGPIPPDTIFPKLRGDWYDIAVAMYHDQGHIPLKMAGFHFDPVKKKWSAVAGVNITLGLPIVRTSVDHGTAFDLAGTGEANELSLRSAIEYAVLLVQNKSV